MITVRHMTEADRPFVRASWYTSFWNEEGRGRIPHDVFQRGQNARMDRLIDRGEVLVAVLTAEPDEILGFAAMRDEALHYVYVKARYRRRGIATGLIRSRARNYSVETRDMRKLLQAVPLQYDPFTLEQE